MRKTIRFVLNGRDTAISTDDRRALLWVLRTELGLTGSKFGCGEGLCGSCTVLVDGKAVRSCQLPVAEVQGARVVTIEGLAEDGVLHPLQAAFAEHEALQCGFCTPGMIMNAYSLLIANPHPAGEEIIDHMDANLCRCGAHARIVQAVRTAAHRMAQRTER
jgi:aerobic-type carbon monoxide dehydrogenase small subunit (CoxS/CutS family)